MFGLGAVQDWAKDTKVSQRAMYAAKCSSYSFTIRFILNMAKLIAPSDVRVRTTDARASVVNVP